MQKKNKPELKRRTTVRLSPVLYDHIQQSAKYNGNTLNGEITARLETTAVTDHYTELRREIAELRSLILEGTKK